MKLLPVFSALAFAVSALADPSPPQWALPNKGKNCVFQRSFEPSRITCGSPRYELWACVSPVKYESAVAGSASYLLIGEYGSATGNSCSPTFFVKSVLRQN